MKDYHMLKCASLTASYTDYEVLPTSDSEYQQKTWTFTAEDLKNFVAALSVRDE